MAVTIGNRFFKKKEGEEEEEKEEQEKEGEEEEEDRTWCLVRLITGYDSESSAAVKGWDGPLVWMGFRR